MKKLHFFPLFIQLKTLNPLLFGDSADREEKMRTLAVTCAKIDEVGKLSGHGIIGRIRANLVENVFWR